jgi:hypothetical protein
MAALLEAGWRLTPEGEKLCGNSAKAALDLDLRDIGAEWLPDDINRGKSTVLEGGCILQVCFLLYITVYLHFLMSFDVFLIEKSFALY